ncbi:MAG: DNA mismatch repair protein MutS [Gallionella sp.]|nr:MAG: DNA mismatch repair protein MutS [Gallionella sp.]
MRTSISPRSAKPDTARGFPQPTVKRPLAGQEKKAEPEDAALFRAAVGEVNPLAEQNRIAPQNSPRKPLPRSPVLPDEIPDTLSDGCPAITSDLAGAFWQPSRMASGSIKGFSDHAPENAPDDFLGNGLPRMTLRKLRRGNWPVRDRLDLHGNNSDAARKLLQAFLHEAGQRELRCVLVIHGKGMNSQGGEAVLRKLTRHWLTRHPRVLAYCDALPKDGGSGAVLVLLKANP